jgi:hypothetical protein
VLGLQYCERIDIPLSPAKDDGVRSFVASGESGSSIVESTSSPDLILGDGLPDRGGSDGNRQSREAFLHPVEAHTSSVFYRSGSSESVILLTTAYWFCLITLLLYCELVVIILIA